MNSSKGQELSNYPWYELGSWEKLQQGDLLQDCPVLVPREELAEHLSAATEDLQTSIPIDVRTFDLVVMSQSCDLANDKIDQVLLCAYFPASGHGREQRVSIAKEHRPPLHMVEKCTIEGAEFAQQIVDFRTIYTLPKEFVVSFANKLGQRVRLLPPYREHLSQAFARYFMRVGLPRELKPD